MYILKANKIIAWLPIFWIVLFWLFVGIVKLEYGKLTAYNSPYPNESKWYFLNNFLLVGIGLVVFLMSISFIISLITYFFEKEQFSWKVIGYQVISMIIFIVHLDIIPSNISNWFFD